VKEVKEPSIVINGVPLTVGQVMAVRTALGSFGLDLQNDSALGEDEHGVHMTRAYRKRLDEVYGLLNLAPTGPT
jgi:hypothetical protein